MKRVVASAKVRASEFELVAVARDATTVVEVAVVLRSERVVALRRNLRKPWAKEASDDRPLSERRDDRQPLARQGPNSQAQ